MKKYNHVPDFDDFSGIATTFVNEASKRGVAVETDPAKAKHMIKNDLRDTLPPQIFSLIGKITDAIEALEE